MIRGTVHLTAYLKEPEGVWEQDVPFECPPDKEKSAMLQVVLSMLNIGLLESISETEFNLIPMGRVKTINVKAIPQNIGLATGADFSAATAAADAGKLIKV